MAPIVGTSSSARGYTRNKSAEVFDRARASNCRPVVHIWVTAAAPMPRARIRAATMRRVWLACNVSISLAACRAMQEGHTEVRLQYHARLMATAYGAHGGTS